jgi:hypothetical protein
VLLCSSHGLAGSLTKQGQNSSPPTQAAIRGTSQLILYPETHVVIALVTSLSGGTWKREEVEAVAEKFAPQK